MTLGPRRGQAVLVAPGLLVDQRAIPWAGDVRDDGEAHCAPSARHGEPGHPQQHDRRPKPAGRAANGAAQLGHGCS